MSLDVLMVEWEKLPEISRKDSEILKWHYSGKRHSWIAKHYKTSRNHILNLIEKCGRGYRVARKKEA